MLPGVSDRQIRVTDHVERVPCDGGFRTGRLWDFFSTSRLKFLVFVLENLWKSAKDRPRMGKVREDLSPPKQDREIAVQKSVK